MIGRETPVEIGYPVLEEEIRKYRAAYDEQDPSDATPGVAGEHVIAPPLFYTIPFAKKWALNGLREDGLAASSEENLRPKLSLTRNMFGGVEIEFFEPVRSGDVLQRQSRLADIYQRDGKTGPLIFAITETTYSNQRGETVCKERTTSIAR